MTVKIDYEKCMKCFACVNTCPHDALSEGENGPVVDAKKCKDCSECVKICPADALSLD